jgi:hypothetical protein
MTKSEKIAKIESFFGQNMDCGELFTELCLSEAKWKYDLEESDLMNFFSRTWAKQGYKAMLFLQEFVCAPPDGEEEILEELVVVKINPADLGKAEPRYTADFDEDSPEYYHALYGDMDYEVAFDNADDEDWDWRENEVALADLPEEIFAELYDELIGALEKAAIED